MIICASLDGNGGLSAKFTDNFGTNLNAIMSADSLDLKAFATLMCSGLKRVLDHAKTLEVSTHWRLDRIVDGILINVCLNMNVSKTQIVSILIYWDFNQMGCIELS